MRELRESASREEEKSRKTSGTRVKKRNLSTSLSTNMRLCYYVDFCFLFQALRGMANENDGHVTCPKTKETFRVDQADKVYVM